MVYGLKKNQNYLLGGHLKMFTYHSALKYMVNKPMLEEKIYLWLLIWILNILLNDYIRRIILPGWNKSWQYGRWTRLGSLNIMGGFKYLLRKNYPTIHGFLSWQIHTDWSRHNLWCLLNMGIVYGISTVEPRTMLDLDTGIWWWKLRHIITGWRKLACSIHFIVHHNETTNSCLKVN